MEMISFNSFFNGISRKGHYCRCNLTDVNIWHVISHTHTLTHKHTHTHTHSANGQPCFCRHMHKHAHMHTRVFPGSKWVFGAQKKNVRAAQCSLCYHVTLLAYILPFHKK